MGISCDGFEEQFKALLVAIKLGRSSALKSTSKKEREIRRFKCSINYVIKEGSGGRDKFKARASNFLP